MRFRLPSQLHSHKSLLTRLLPSSLQWPKMLIVVIGSAPKITRSRILLVMYFLIWAMKPPVKFNLTPHQSPRGFPAYMKFTASIARENKSTQAWNPARTVAHKGHRDLFVEFSWNFETITLSCLGLIYIWSIWTYSAFFQKSHVFLDWNSSLLSKTQLVKRIRRF